MRNTLEHLGVSYRWSLKSPSSQGEVAEAEAANLDVTKILTQMIGAEIALVRDGYHVGPADDGYIVRRIKVDGKKKCIQVPDPQRAPFYRAIFAMRAEGTYSDKEIVDHLNSQGYRSRSVNLWDETKTKVIGRRLGRPLSVKRLQEIIRRPVYCGVAMEKWTQGIPVRAKGGEAIVSIDTYNAANRGKSFIRENDDGTLSMLYDQCLERLIKRRTRYSSRWKYKNVVLCPTCRRPLWASASRSRSGRYFGFYHCARKHTRYAVPQARLERIFDSFFASVRFAETWWDDFAMLCRVEYDAAFAVTRDEGSRAVRAVAALENQQAQLAEAFALATSESMRKAIEKRMEVLDAEIAGLAPTRSLLDITTADFEKFLNYSRRLLEHPSFLLDFIGNYAEQAALFGLFFAQFPTLDEILSGTPKLTAVFSTFCRSADEKSAIVHNSGLDWNQLRAEILRWQDAYWAIDRVFKRYEDSLKKTALPNDATDLERAA